MANILKDLIKKALKEADDAAMKKSAKGMAMYGKKAKMKEAEVATGNECTTCKDCPGGCKYNDCSSGYCVDQGSAPKSSKSKSKDKPKRKLRKEAEITVGDEQTKFKLKVDVSNKQSETKLGVRIQLTPKEGMLEPDVRDSLEATIMKKLNTSLGQYDIQVSKDTDVPNPEVLGFFIPLAQIKNMIVKSIKGSGGSSFKPDLEKDALQRDKIGQMMDKEKQAQAAKQTTNESINDLISDQLITEMRQRTLNEISQIVMREDFYGFVNAGNNMLRSLEERGYDMREAKKYLGYLVKHNIM